MSLKFMMWKASFNNMSIDEKLAEIANLIENMLKKNGKS